MHIETGHEQRGKQPKSSTESVSGFVSEQPAARESAAKTEWICPMHASVVREAPGECPLCGMKLEARTVAEGTADSPPFRIPIWLGACLFSAIALYFLWDEHEVHILSALPYLLLASCPLIHLFMHRGHGHGGASHEGHAHHRGES